MGLVVGDRHVRRPIQGYGGRPVSYASYRLPLDRLGRLARRGRVHHHRAGSPGPGEREKPQSGYLMARKPT